MGGWEDRRNLQYGLGRLHAVTYRVLRQGTALREDGLEYGTGVLENSRERQAPYLRGYTRILTRTLMFQGQCKATSGTAEEGSHDSQAFPLL